MHAGRPKIGLEIQDVTQDETPNESYLRKMRPDLIALTCAATANVDFLDSEDCVTVSIAGTRI